MNIDTWLLFDLIESRSYRSYVKTLNRYAPIISRRTLVRNIEDECSGTLPIVEKDFDNIDGLFSITCN